MKAQCEKCHGSIFTLKTEEDFLKIDTCSKCDHDSYNNRIKFCFKFNGLKLEAKKKIDLNQFGVPPEFVPVYKNFLSTQKKSRNKEIIELYLENPDDYHIVKAMNERDVASMHMINRNPIFVGDLKADRHKYVKLSEIDGEPEDIPVFREFKGWASAKITVKGPILDENDKKIYYACLRIHHNNGSKGLNLKTNFSEIWRTIGNKGFPSCNNIAALKRSLKRLHETAIGVTSKDNSSYWGGSFFSCLRFHDNASHSVILITLNSDCIPIYHNGEFTPLNMDLFLSLKSYPRRMYEFMLTHDDPDRVMSLKKWQEVLGSEKLSAVDFKKRVKSALKDLIEAKICDVCSKIDEKNFLFTKLTPEHIRSTGHNLI